jgi:hypothetical protein
MSLSIKAMMSSAMPVILNGIKVGSRKINEEMVHIKLL